MDRPPACKHMLELEARIHALAGRQRNRGLRRQPRVVLGLLGQHRLLDEQRPVGLQFADQGRAPSARRRGRGNRCRIRWCCRTPRGSRPPWPRPHRRRALPSSMRISSHAIHLEGVEAQRLALADLLDDVGRAIAADPAIGLHPVAHQAAQQLVHRHAQGLALDVPQRLVDAGDRAHQHRAAAIERRRGTCVCHRSLMRDGSLPTSNRRFRDRRLDRAGAAFDHRLAPADDALVGFHLQEHPAWRHVVGAESGDLHRRWFLKASMKDRRALRVCFGGLAGLVEFAAEACAVAAGGEEFGQVGRRDATDGEQRNMAGQHRVQGAHVAGPELKAGNSFSTCAPAFERGERFAGGGKAGRAQQPAPHRSGDDLGIGVGRDHEVAHRCRPAHPRRPGSAPCPRRSARGFPPASMPIRRCAASPANWSGSRSRRTRIRPARPHAPSTSSGVMPRRIAISGRRNGIGRSMLSRYTCVRPPSIRMSAGIDEARFIAGQEQRGMRDFVRACRCAWAAASRSARSRAAPGRAARSTSARCARPGSARAKSN